MVERSEYQPYIEQNKKNIDADSQTYKRRQAIVEHPYGIIKRQWGFYYITTKKGLKRASADVGMMFVAFNLRRLMNIIDTNSFKKFLKELLHLFSLKTSLANAIAVILGHLNFTNRFLKMNCYNIYSSLKLNYI